MRNLLHVLGEDTAGGAFMPEVLPRLSARGFHFRRSQMAMIAAVPNGGKSALAHWYAVKACEVEQPPTLFFSADTDRQTMMKRTIAMRSGRTLTEVEQQLATQPAFAFEQDVDVPWIRWNFDSQPSMDDIYEEVEAFSLVYGPPHLIVIDNLLNLAPGGGEEWTAMRDALSAIHHLTHETEACTLVLHHVSEAKAKPGWPPSRAEILGKLNQYPEQILTLGLDPTNGIMRVAAVKDRNGHHDATGNTFVQVSVDLPRMTFYDSDADKRLAEQARSWV